MSSGSAESFAASRGYSDGRVRIRRFSRDDVLSLFGAVSESIGQLSGCIGLRKGDYSLWDSAAFIRKCEAEWVSGWRYAFAILEEKQHAFVGSAWLSCVNYCRKSATIGIWVRSSRDGQDFTAAATRLVARFGFGELALSQLELIGSAPAILRP